MTDEQPASMPGDNVLDQEARIEFARRAKLLAEDSQAEVCARETGSECLVVRLAGEAMAVETRFVVEVLRSPEICTIPCTPGHILGVVNIRGRVVAAVDAGLFWGLRREPKAKPAVVVLAAPADEKAQGMEFGLAVDAVEDVIRLPTVLQPPNLLASSISELVTGVAPGPVLVLDTARLLEDRGLSVQEEVV